jgi:Glycosyl hydrolase family 9
VLFPARCVLALVASKVSAEQSRRFCAHADRCPDETFIAPVSNRLKHCRFGQSYPTHVHSRDASYPNWGTTKPDGNTLCGAMVSGPFTAPPGSTDLYTDDRSKYEETEAGVDYSGSIICALAGYASLAEHSFDHCSGAGRSAFDGRV